MGRVQGGEGLTRGASDRNVPCRSGLLGCTSFGKGGAGGGQGTLVTRTLPLISNGAELWDRPPPARAQYQLPFRGGDICDSNPVRLVRAQGYGYRQGPVAAQRNANGFGKWGFLNSNAAAALHIPRPTTRCSFRRLKHQLHLRWRRTWKRCLRARALCSSCKDTIRLWDHVLPPQLL